MIGTFLGSFEVICGES